MLPANLVTFTDEILNGKLLFFFAVYAFRLQNDLFTVSLNLKRICNSNNTMKKRNVACLKMNRFFKNYSFQHKRKLVLEKALEQGVSKVYSQILENACQTSLVFFCAWSSSNTCVTRPMHVLDIHTFMKNLYESVNPMRNWEPIVSHTSCIIQTV